MVPYIGFPTVKDLIQNAKAYREKSQESIKRNSHMNSNVGEVDQKAIDAVLVDFINYLSLRTGMDLALYTVDFLPDITVKPEP